MVEDRLPKYSEEYHEIMNRKKAWDESKWSKKSRKYQAEMSTLETRIKALKRRMMQLGKKENIVVVKGILNGRPVKIPYTNISNADAIDVARYDYKGIEITNTFELIPGNPYSSKL